MIWYYRDEPAIQWLYSLILSIITEYYHSNGHSIKKNTKTIMGMVKQIDEIPCFLFDKSRFDNSCWCFKPVAYANLFVDRNGLVDTKSAGWLPLGIKRLVRRVKTHENSANVCTANRESTKLLLVHSQFVDLFDRKPWQTRFLRIFPVLASGKRCFAKTILEAWKGYWLHHGSSHTAGDRT